MKEKLESLIGRIVTIMHTQAGTPLRWHYELTGVLTKSTSGQYEVYSVQFGGINFEASDVKQVNAYVIAINNY